MDMVRWIKQVGPIGGLIFIAKMNMAFERILTLDDFDFRHRELGGDFLHREMGFFAFYFFFPHLFLDHFILFLPFDFLLGYTLFTFFKFFDFLEIWKPLQPKR